MRCSAIRHLEAFWVPALAWLGLAVVAGLASFVGTYATAVGGERFLLRLRDKVFAHMQTLTPDFSENRRLGDLMARLTDDIEAIEELIGSGLVRLFMTIASVIFFAGAAFYIRWDLALVTMDGPGVPAGLEGLRGEVQDAAARERLSNGDDEQRPRGGPGQPVARPGLQPSEEPSRERLHDEGCTWLRPT